MPASAIFGKERLRPSQLRTVADRRFADAQALRETGDNARANGAMYLGGFVIECLLKARLLEKFKFLQNARSPEKLSDEERRLWSLCYRSHDLAEILLHLPEVNARLSSGLEKREGRRRMQGLMSICDEWTIFARYSPQMATMKVATSFLNMIKDLKEWLK